MKERLWQDVESTLKRVHYAEVPLDMKDWEEVAQYLKNFQSHTLAQYTRTAYNLSEPTDYELYDPWEHSLHE